MPLSKKPLPAQQSIEWWHRTREGALRAKIKERQGTDYECFFWSQNTPRRLPTQPNSAQH